MGRELKLTATRLLQEIYQKDTRKLPESYQKATIYKKATRKDTRKLPAARKLPEIFISFPHTPLIFETVKPRDQQFDSFD